MPDEELQSLYAEASKRGLFKSDPDMQRIGHEMRARKMVTDPTQGGLVTPEPKTQPKGLELGGTTLSNDPVGSILAQTQAQQKSELPKQRPSMLHGATRAQGPPTGVRNLPGHVPASKMRNPPDYASLGITEEQARRQGIVKAQADAKEKKDAAAIEAERKASMERLRFATQHNFGLPSLGAPNNMTPAEIRKDKHLRQAQAQAQQEREERMGPDTLLENLGREFGIPGVEKTLHDSSGASGALQKFAGGLVDSLPDLAIAAASEGLLAPGSGVVNRVFQAQMLQGLAETAGNEKLRKSDPRQFFFSLFLQASALAGTSERFRDFLGDKLQTAVTGENAEARAKTLKEKVRAQAEAESYKKLEQRKKVESKKELRNQIMRSWKETPAREDYKKQQAMTPQKPLSGLKKAEEEARSEARKSAHVPPEQGPASGPVKNKPGETKREIEPKEESPYGRPIADVKQDLEISQRSLELLRNRYKQEVREPGSDVYGHAPKKIMEDIRSINQHIQNLKEEIEDRENKEKGNAVQKQGSGKGVLGKERPEVGLPQVGKGDKEQVPPGKEERKLDEQGEAKGKVPDQQGRQGESGEAKGEAEKRSEVAGPIRDPHTDPRGIAGNNVTPILSDNAYTNFVRARDGRTKYREQRIAWSGGVTTYKVRDLGKVRDMLSKAIVEHMRNLKEEGLPLSHKADLQAHLDKILDLPMYYTHTLPGSRTGTIAAIVTDPKTGEPLAVFATHSNSTPRAMANSLIHEVRHGVQTLSGHSLALDQKQHGYHERPSELDAREFAHKVTGLGYPRAIRTSSGEIKIHSTPGESAHPKTHSLELHGSPTIVSVARPHIADISFGPGGVKSAATKATEAKARIFDNTRNKIYEGSSHLRAMAKEGAKKSYEWAIRASSSYATAAEEARYHVPKVLAQMDEQGQQRFQPYLVYDRAMQERYTKMAQLHMKNLELKSAIASRLPQSKLDSIGKQIRNLQRDIKQNIVTRNEGTKLPVPGVTLDDPVTGVPITDDMAKNYFADSNVQKALDYHKANIEPILRENFEYDGRMATGDIGYYSRAFTPAITLDENGMPNGMYAATGGRFTRLNEVPSKPGKQQFRASAKYYNPDYASAIAGRFASGYRARNTYQMFKSMTDEGVLQPIFLEGKTKAGVASKSTRLKGRNPNVDIDKDTGKIKIKVNGKWEEATKPFAIQSKINPYMMVGAKYSDLPATEVVMPQRIYNEIEPLFYKEGQEPYQDTSNRLASNVVALNLMGLGEAGGHGRGLSSRLGKAIPFMTRGVMGSKVGKAIQTGPLTALNSFFQMANTIGGTWRFDEATRHEAALESAKAGAMPSQYVTAKPVRGQGIKEGAKSVGFNALKAGGIMLYGPRGILSNVHTSIYKYYKDAGLLSDPAAVIQMHEDMRFMNTHSEILSSRIGRGKSGLGRMAGTFAQTGFRNRTASYRGGLANYAARIAGTTLMFGALAKARDPEHRYPWQIPGYTTGNIYLGEDANGNNLQLNTLQFMDRTQDYGQVWLNDFMKAYSSGEDTGDLLQNLYQASVKAGPQEGMDVYNSFMTPRLSGPVRIGEEFLGWHPSYLTYNDQGLIRPYEQKPGALMGWTDLDSYKFRTWRAMKALVGMLWITDPDEYSISVPDNKKVRILNNYLLHATGSPPVKSESEGETMRVAAKRQRKQMINEREAGRIIERHQEKSDE